MLYRDILCITNNSVVQYEKHRKSNKEESKNTAYTLKRKWSAPDTQWKKEGLDLRVNSTGAF